MKSDNMICFSFMSIYLNLFFFQLQLDGIKFFLYRGFLRKIRIKANIKSIQTHALLVHFDGKTQLSLLLRV